MTKSKDGIPIKTAENIRKMVEGGKRLARVKKKLKEAVKTGVSADDIEKLAVELIKKEGGQPSFQMVPKYNWATCVNINQGVVHGIPKKEIIFKKGDVVSVDIGMYYQGFHTDTSFSVGPEVSEEISDFLAVGETALKSAILKSIAGNRIFDVSEAIETVIKSKNLKPIRSLVGHGIGRKLHEKPQIPCFTNGKREESPEICEGMTFAIEIMYTKGSGNVCLGDDKWTIVTKDGKIAALFEETIVVTKDSPIILTR